jgi:hypothetical protein
VPLRRSSVRLQFERLEARLVLSAGPPLNLIGNAQGTVSAPGAVAEVSMSVAPHNLSARPSTVFRVGVSPNPGSSLNPTIPFALGPNGSQLTLRHGTPFSVRRQTAAAAFTRVSEPGPLTTAVTGLRGTTGSFTAQTTLPGDVNGDGHVDLNDLKAFVVAFETHRGDAFYKPSADANQNGFVGQGDARFILRNLTPLTPKIPLQLKLHLAPGEQVLHPDGIHNSGGITRQTDITILGHTTPGSIVFSDAAQGNFAFNGRALATDAQGNFQEHAHLTSALTNFTYLAIDPYGQQKIESFPVLLLS